MTAPPGPGWFRWRHLAVTLLPGVLWFVLANELEASPWGMARLRAVAGHERIPDLQLHRYDGAEAYALIAALGEQGRQVYAGMLWVADGVFPPLYGLGLAVAVGCLCSGRWRWLTLLPLAAALADWGENACVLAMLAAFPGHAPLAEALAGWCTSGKWLLLALTMAVIVSAGLVRLVRWRSGGGRSHG